MKALTIQDLTLMYEFYRQNCGAVHDCELWRFKELIKEKNFKSLKNILGRDYLKKLLTIKHLTIPRPGSEVISRIKNENKHKHFRKRFDWKSGVA